MSIHGGYGVFQNIFLRIFLGISRVKYIEMKGYDYYTYLINKGC